MRKRALPDGGIIGTDDNRQAAVNIEHSRVIAKVIDVFVTCLNKTPLLLENPKKRSKLKKIVRLRFMILPPFYR